jgi:hypothetical protein
MKTKVKEGKKNRKNSFWGKPTHYFHTDEDFREDNDWGKSKSPESGKEIPPRKSLQSDVMLPKVLKNHLLDLN